MVYKLVKAMALKWHKILSCVGPKTIKQLFKYINGVKLTELTNKQVLLKVECRTYLIIKYT